MFVGVGDHGNPNKNPDHKSVRVSDRKYAVLSLTARRSWKGADEEWHSRTEWLRAIAPNSPEYMKRAAWSSVGVLEGKGILHFLTNRCPPNCFPTL